MSAIERTATAFLMSTGLLQQMVCVSVQTIHYLRTLHCWQAEL
jgi:hypothetical protein